MAYTISEAEMFGATIEEMLELLGADPAEVWGE